MVLITQRLKRGPFDSRVGMFPEVFATFALSRKNLTVKQWRLKLNTQFSPMPPCSF